MGRPQTVDEYVSGFTGPSRELLEQLRALAQEAVPEASEAIKWGHPAWVHPSGTILFMISGHAKHGSIVFTPSTREKFDAIWPASRRVRAPSSFPTAKPCRPTCSAE